MTDASDDAIFARGDVVFGADPFKEAEAARPWLVVSNHEGRPFHGEQYLTLTLTTKSWLDGLVEIPTDAWVRGGTPKQSRVVPWGVQALASSDIERWQGRVREHVVENAVSVLVDELRT